MVEQVLLYLPVLSLLRFKAVCKYWFSLIESSTFISGHLNRNRENKDNFIIFSWQKFALLSVREYEECVYDIEVEQFWPPASNYVLLIGYCDGILCFRHGVGHGVDEITLWNPALKQVKSLPPPLFSDRFVSENYRSYSTFTSFGIDVKSNDYKVVRIVVTFGEKCRNQVEVYNLGGDNSWRIIHKDDVLPFTNIETTAAVCSVKFGKCFWIATRYDRLQKREIPILLSFDFNDDMFRAMLLPVEQLYGYIDLDLLDDKIVYFTEVDIWSIDKSIAIWMLHEFGVENSWNLIYNIGPLAYFDIFYPRQFSKNGEFLICSKLVEGKYIFYLYNLHTQQGKYHQKCNLRPRFGQIIHYSASLLSLRSANNVRRNE